MASKLLEESAASSRFPMRVFVPFWNLHYPLSFGTKTVCIAKYEPLVPAPSSDQFFPPPRTPPMWRLSEQKRETLYTVFMHNQTADSK